MIEAREVAECLAGLGVTPGDVICVHSSVKDLSRERTRDGMIRQAEELIEGLKLAVGEDGTIVMPTFTYCNEGNPRGEVYHPDKTKSRTGFLTELFRKTPDVVRSRQPTHSVAAWGRLADELTDGHENVNPLGVDSPLHRLVCQGGKVVFLGTDFKTCSLIHVAESVGGAPYVKVFRYGYLGWTPVALMEGPSGETIRLPIEEVPGCSQHFDAIHEPMERRGLVRSAPLGRGVVSVFLATDLIETTREELAKDPYFLLCPAGDCPTCDAARKGK